MVAQGANNAELIRLIENLVRPGTVAEVDHAAARCRVQSGGLTTNWLPWIAHRAGDIRHWSPPSPGEQCLLFAPGGDIASAFVLVGIYSDAQPANAATGTTERTTYPDGAVIDYDHAAHALSVTLPAGGTADITVPASVTIHCATADITATDSATVHSRQITLDAPKTVATGELRVEGLLTFAAGMVGAGAGPGGAVAAIEGTLEVRHGDVIAEGISLVKHRHPGVVEGGDMTEAPTR